MPNFWGDSIKFGSEHRFGDEQFAGEFVCYHYNNEKYSSIEEAEAALEIRRRYWPFLEYSRRLLVVVIPSG